ncbi:hypothetical protein [Cloacibacterium normanense]
MKKVIFSFAFLSVISCNYPKEYSSYEDSKEHCCHLKRQKEILCYFKGFEMSEIEKLVIEEQDNENKILTTINDFKIIYYQEATKETTVLISHDIFYDKKYVFKLENQVFVVNNIKVEPKPTFTMTSKNYTCLINKMDINGITYERMTEPIFVKK